MGSNVRLSFREKLSFGLGAFSKDIFSVVIVSYLMVFYTDVFGLTASMAGLVLLVTKLIDAVSNPLLGALMDRTSTRWGRFRPYIACALVPFGGAIMLLFYVPDLSLPMKFVYALITYNLAGLLFTCIDVAIWGMVPSLTRRLDERSQLIASGRAFSNVAGMIMAPLVLPIVLFMGAGNTEQGYFWLGVVVAALSCTFGLLLVINVKERHTVEHTAPMTLRMYGRVIKGNPGVMWVVGCMLVFGLGVGLQNGVGVYYMKYFLQRPELIPAYIFTSYTFKVIGALIAPFLIAKFGLGNCRTALLSFLTLAGTSFLMWFVSAEQIVAYLTLTAMASLGIGGLLVSITGMMAEMGDTVEAAHGQRLDGVLFSLNALAMQAGFAVSAALAGILMDVSGYIPNVVTQSSEALAAIQNIRCLGPALICTLGVIAVRAYGRHQHAQKGELFVAGTHRP